MCGCLQMSRSVLMAVETERRRLAQVERASEASRIAAERARLESAVGACAQRIDKLERKERDLELRERELHALGARSVPTRSGTREVRCFSCTLLCVPCWVRGIALPCTEVSTHEPTRALHVAVGISEPARGLRGWGRRHCIAFHGGLRASGAHPLG